MHGYGKEKIHITIGTECCATNTDTMTRKQEKRGWGRNCTLQVLMIFRPIHILHISKSDPASGSFEPISGPQPCVDL